MKKKIYEAPHVQVIEIEYGSYLLAESPGSTFNMGTKPGGDGEYENGGSYDGENPDDID